MGLFEPHGRYGRCDGRLPITPRIVFAGYADAVFYLEGARLVERPISLITPEGASCYLGAAWFAALQDLLQPFGPTDIVYDCADRTGDALRAFRHGIRAVRVDPSIHTPALCDLAAQQDVTLEAERGECMAFPADKRGKAEFSKWLSDQAH